MEKCVDVHCVSLPRENVSPAPRPRRVHPSWLNIALMTRSRPSKRLESAVPSAMTGSDAYLASWSPFPLTLQCAVFFSQVWPRITYHQDLGCFGRFRGHRQAVVRICAMVAPLLGRLLRPALHVDQQEQTAVASNARLAAQRRHQAVGMRRS